MLCNPKLRVRFFCLLFFLSVSVSVLLRFTAIKESRMKRVGILVEFNYEDLEVGNSSELVR